MLFALGAMVGSNVKVQLSSGGVYYGVLRSAVPVPGAGVNVVLNMAYKHEGAAGACLHPACVLAMTKPILAL